MTLQSIAAILQIIAIDIVLSGDNAVVIAMAAHRLPGYQRQRAILWGAGIAIFLRIVFTLVMAFLLTVPGLRLAGGLVLVLIACKLLLEEQERLPTADEADRSAMAAIRTIFLADFVMSLDNMLAVAGASHGDPVKLLFGLAVSIAIIMTCSAFIAVLMNRFRFLVYAGAGILAFTAAEMIVGDREVAGFFTGTGQVCLDRHWHAWMLAEEHVSQMPNLDKASPELRKRIEYRDGVLTVIGRMSESDRDELLALNPEPGDRDALAQLYSKARVRTVPDWLPPWLKPHVERWAQHKWSAERWEQLSGRHHHAAAWAFYCLVVGVCLLAPYWWPAKKVGEKDTHGAASVGSAKE